MEGAPRVIPASELVLKKVAAPFFRFCRAFLAALAGELASNCCDHNLGAWRDVSGCWFSFSGSKNGITVIVADRGQGILKSLQQADSSINSEEQALNIALTKQLSGRKPERRGRGLKFIVTALDNQLANSSFELFSGHARFSAKFPLNQEIINYINSDPATIQGTFASHSSVLTMSLQDDRLGV